MSDGCSERAAVSFRSRADVSASGLSLCIVRVTAGPAERRRPKSIDCLYVRTHAIVAGVQSQVQHSRDVFGTLRGRRRPASLNPSQAAASTQEDHATLFQEFRLYGSYSCKQSLIYTAIECHILFQASVSLLELPVRPITPCR